MPTDPRDPDSPQRITVTIDLHPSPMVEPLASAVLYLLVSELAKSSRDITSISVQLHGNITAW